MGLRYRKSINLGMGFRVNISSSGIGYSWGTKGYRITKNASGKTRQTVSIPGTGISYVEESGGKRNTSSAPAQKDRETLIAENFHDIEEVTSASTTMLQSEAYKELSSQTKKIQILVYGIIIATLILSILSGLPMIFVIGFIVALILGIKFRPSVEYSFDNEQQERWNEISGAWRAVAKSCDLQEITLLAKANDPRTNAGIKESVDTSKMKAGKTLPWFMKTNVTPVVFTMKKHTLAIMPDRLLFFQGGLGAVDYSEVKFELFIQGFLVEGKTPKDSELIQYVWRYANKDGSRDKRYSNNSQYPIMKYSKIFISSNSGLNIQFLCSNGNAVDNLNSVLEKYSLI
ncbi:MAG: DUF4236 domain-containing protein [Oscillospiraceae bacterium]|nr:DUF4236 domain-containing protein [Oscillospiraceae bacterium]